METKDIIIIGGGPAGLTAALYGGRARLSAVVFAGQFWGGQLMLTTKVENYPGFPGGILGPELMDKIETQVKDFGAEIFQENVTKVDFTKRPFLVGSEKREYLAQAVIIATGASSLWLGLPNEQKLIGHGVSSCAPCDAYFFKGQDVAVVGGGDSAMEEALVLAKFANHVTILNRSNKFKASDIMLERVRTNPKITVLLNKVVTKILGEEKVQGLDIKDMISDQKELLSVTGLFVAIGHKPATDIFKGHIDLDERGYIKIHEETKTSVEGVFVAGDAADPAYRQAVTAAGFGCMAALDCEKWLEKRELRRAES